MTTNFYLIAVGKNKDKALQALLDDYLQRLHGQITLIELSIPQCDDASRKKREADLIRAALPPKATLIILDERGEDLSSIEFATCVGRWIDTGKTPLAFVIGGADGLDEEFRHTADMVLCFGHLTWPHMLVRLLLVEQIYRATTILAGHPYHRV